MKKLLILSITALSLYACGGGKQNGTENAGTSTENTAASTEAKSYEFTVNGIGNNMAEMAYDTKELKVTAGAKVKITLTNKATDASMLHNLVIVKQGSEKDVAMEGINLKESNYFNAQNPSVIGGSGLAGPGQSVEFEFTAPTAGTYSFICTYPGHWTKMQGTLIVE